jgi:hypothetical protein
MAPTLSLQHAALPAVFKTPLFEGPVKIQNHLQINPG